MAVRGIKWPGRANLVVSLVAIHKGAWHGKRALDGRDLPLPRGTVADRQSDRGGNRGALPRTPPEPHAPALAWPNQHLQPVPHP